MSNLSNLELIDLKNRLESFKKLTQSFIILAEKYDLELSTLLEKVNDEEYEREQKEQF